MSALRIELLWFPAVQNSDGELVLSRILRTEHAMNLEKLMSMTMRVLFVGSLVLLAIAVLERLLNLLGYTILPDAATSPGRLLEFATMFLVVVIAFLLRQVRDELRHAHR